MSDSKQKMEHVSHTPVSRAAVCQVSALQLSAMPRISCNTFWAFDEASCRSQHLAKTLQLALMSSGAARIASNGHQVQLWMPPDQGTQQ
jgi:hypothetical protein